MRYKCYLCGKRVETNDLFSRLALMIENKGDIITTIEEHLICGWCVSHFFYYKKIITEAQEKEKNEKEKIKRKQRKG